MIKKIFLLCLFLSMEGSVFSQKYREIFDQLDSQDSGLSSLNSNFDRSINGDNTYLLEAYLYMFKATNDIRYLNKFVITAKRIQDSRDDNISSAVALNIPTVIEIKEDDGDIIATCSINNVGDITSSKAWSVYDGNVPTSCEFTQMFKEAGEICTPMAEFILLLKTDYSSVQYNTLPDEVNSITASHHNYGSLVVTNYKEFAYWLEIRIRETIASFDASYANSCPETYCSNPLYPYRNDENCCNQPENTVSNYSYYSEKKNNTGGINQQLYMGALLAYMYQISVIDGTDGDPVNEEYLFKVRNMLYDFMHHLADGENVIDDDAGGAHPPVEGGEISNIWCHKYDCGGANWEDVSHAVIDVKFMHLCYKFGIPNIMGVYIPTSEMRSLSNTFAYLIVSNPLVMHKNVTGGDDNCNQCYPDTSPSQYGYYTGQYTFLTEYNPKIYQIISDFYAPDNISNYDISGPAARLGYSSLAFYENLFNPIAVQRNSFAPGYSYNSGACGDFTDGDGNKVFVLSRIVGGGSSIDTKIIEHKLDNSNNIVTLNTFTKAGRELHFLSKGEIVPGNSQDEFVAIDLVNEYLEIYKIEAASLVNILQVSLSSLGLDEDNIEGTAVADFQPLIPGDEIVVNTKSAGVLFLKMYYFNGTSLIQIPTTISGGTLSAINGFCSGQFDATGENQIAVYQNSTNKIEIYRFDGDDEFIPVSSGTIPTPGEVWKGICSGDFDGTGIDELMLYQENAATGRFEIFSVISGVVTLKDLEYFPKNQKNHMMCSMRFDKYGQSDALVTFRDYDSQISIFNMEGLCPGLNLSSQTIDENTTIDIDNTISSTESSINNYPIDYHVNGTLIAGNNFNILAPSIVDMSSGKEINFKPGFRASEGCDLHAYIEPALECSPSTFRRNTPNVPENNTQRYSSQPKKNVINTNIGITPNPNNGSFQIMVTRNDKPVGIKEIKVYDIMGKMIWETTASSNNVFIVDITSYASGIYYVKSINEFDEMEMKKLIKQ